MRCIRSQLWVDVDIDRTLPASNRSLRRILLLVSGCCIIAKRKTRKTTFCNLTAMNCNYAVCTLQLSLTSAFRTPRSRALHMRLCTYAFLVHQKHIRPHTRVCMCIMMMMMAWGAAKGEIRLLTSPLHFMAMLGFYFFSIFCAVFSVFYFLHYVEASRFRCDSVSHSTGKLGAGRKEMGDAKLGNLWVLHHHKPLASFISSPSRSAFRLALGLLFSTFFCVPRVFLRLAFLPGQYFIKFIEQLIKQFLTVDLFDERAPSWKFQRWLLLICRNSPANAVASFPAQRVAHWSCGQATESKWNLCIFSLFELQLTRQLHARINIYIHAFMHM